MVKFTDTEKVAISAVLDLPKEIPGRTGMVRSAQLIQRRDPAAPSAESLLNAARNTRDIYFPPDRQEVVRATPRNQRPKRGRRNRPQG